MALLAIFSTDRALRNRLERSLEPHHEVLGTPSWGGLHRLVRQRPAVAAVVDLEAVGAGGGVKDRLGSMRRAYPGLGLVVVAHRYRDPVALFRLGKAGIRNLVLVGVDEVETGVGRAVGRELGRGTASLVTRVMSPYLPRRELGAVRVALEGVHRCWSAEAFAEEVGLSRPFLSECLKAHGLPSAGHLLLWTRLFHAGFWLGEPGRTAESVSRQLEYSSGAAFRRALKHYTGATPTEVIERGGLRFVIGRFLAECGLQPSRIAAPALALARG